MSKYGSDFIAALTPAKYNYIPEMSLKGIDPDKAHFGVMAQHIDAYLKSVSDEDFNILQKDEDDKFMVNYYELIAPMIKTIQELTARVEHLERKTDDIY